jgi:glutaminyl-peptide cyclotransferase
MIFYVILFIYSQPAWALAEKTDDLQVIESEFQRFVRSPHPLGSAAQLKYSEHLKEKLSKSAKKTEFQSFEVKHPESKKKLTGRNVIAHFSGVDPCLLFIAGHYDTKEFTTGRFVGANDGGSSTVLKIALAQRIGRSKKFGTGTWGACALQLIFFDGEEAFLKEWGDGEKRFAVQDNLYGSRKFVEEKMPKKPELLLLIDMIGHKDQKLFVTSGSDKKASDKLIKNKGKVAIEMVEMGIEDDHIPFYKKGVSFVHVIDWTNLKEWHTVQDDLKIVSAQKVANALEMIWGFLHETRN